MLQWVLQCISTPCNGIKQHFLSSDNALMVFLIYFFTFDFRGVALGVPMGVAMFSTPCLAIKIAVFKFKIVFFSVLRHCNTSGCCNGCPNGVAMIATPPLFSISTASNKRASQRFQTCPDNKNMGLCHSFRLAVNIAFRVFRPGVL